MNLFHTLLLLLTAFLLVFAESAFDFTRRVLGAQVDLLPGLMVYASLTGNLATLALVSVCGGLCFDALSANPLGASILPLFTVGFVIHLKRGLILRDQFTAHWVLGLMASAAAPALTLLVLLSAGQSPLLGWSSLWQWVVMSVLGGLLTPILFGYFALINSAFTYRPAKEISFRPDREIRRGRS